MWIDINKNNILRKEEKEMENKKLVVKGTEMEVVDGKDTILEEDRKLYEVLDLGLVLFILSKMFVNVGMRLSNRMVGRTVDFSMNGWYLFSGICVAAGVVMIVVAQVIKKNNN